MQDSRDGGQAIKGDASRKSGGQVACISVIAANNAPLYLRVFPSSGCDLDVHQLQEVMYNSLDVVEERTSLGANSSSRRSGASNGGDLGGFVGCLAVVGPLSVFGWVTATRRKVLLAITGGEPEPKDVRVRGLFKRVVMGMANRAADPFAKLDGALGGPRFEAAVRDAVTWFAERESMG